MRKRVAECLDEVAIAKVMVSFVFLGAGTVAVALAAHVR